MSLDLTKLTDAAVRAKELFTAFEHRLSNYGMFYPFLQGGDALLPKGTVEAWKNAHNAAGLYFPVLTRQDMALITERSCNITGTGATSAKPTITKITRGFEIKIYPKVNENNLISETEEMANQMRSGMRKVAEALDTYSLGVLEAKKNTALETVSLDGVSIAGNAYQVAPDKALEFYTDVRVMMERNDIAGNVLHNITNTEALALIMKYETLGANNSENVKAILEGTAPSAVGQFRHSRSNRMTSGAGVQETHYIAPFGTLGLFTWNDSDALAKRKAGAKETSTFYDPILGIRWDVITEDICEDLSETMNDDSYARTFGTKYQFVADFAFFTAYSSTSASPIVKVELLKTV